MELLFALIATGLSVAYAFAIARGIERRKRWALDMVRAISALEGRSTERHLYEDLQHARSLAESAEADADGDASTLINGRLAA